MKCMANINEISEHNYSNIGQDIGIAKFDQFTKLTKFTKLTGLTKITFRQYN